MQNPTDEGRAAAQRAAVHASEAAGSAGLAAHAAGQALGVAAGVAGERGRDALERGRELAEEALERARPHLERGREAAEVAAERARPHLERGREAAEVAAGRGLQLAAAVREHASDLPAAAALDGVVEEALERGADAWDALRGRRPRRWTWALGSALAGAAAAAAVTVLVRRLGTRDAPGAQDPELVRAVVDTVPATPTPPAGATVDEDGEAVLPAASGQA